MVAGARSKHETARDSAVLADKRLGFVAVHGWVDVGGWLVQNLLVQSFLVVIEAHAG